MLATAHAPKTPRFEDTRESIAGVCGRSRERIGPNATSGAGTPAPSDRCQNKRTGKGRGREGVPEGRTSAGNGVVWEIRAAAFRRVCRRVSPQWARAVMACAAARSPADQDRFVCIYPAYLNNKKTIAEGRRIPISKAVENPTATEIQDVCSAVGLNAFLEKNKMYSREWNRDAQYRGRVRIQLKQEDGSLCLTQFPSRKSVMLYAAEMIPKLKTRTQKTGGSDQTLQQGEGSKKGKGKKKK